MKIKFCHLFTLARLHIVYAPQENLSLISAAKVSQKVKH